RRSSPTRRARSRARRAPSHAGSARAAALPGGSRGSYCAGAAGPRTARTSSPLLRQAEHALGHDVAMHLRRSGVDGAGARPEELARPVDVGAGGHARAQELPPRPEQLERHLAEALVELAPVDLLERGLGTRRPVVGHVGEHAQPVRAQHLVLDHQPRELLALRSAGAAMVAERPAELAEVAAVARRQGEAHGAALVGEHGHRDAPALADLADEVLPRHTHVLEEHLAELALARDLAQRPHLDAGRIELAEDEGDAAVAVLSIGAGEHEDPVGPRAERGP